MKELSAGCDSSPVRGTKKKLPVKEVEEEQQETLPDPTAKIQEMPAEVRNNIWEHLVHTFAVPPDGTFSLEHKILVKGKTPADPDHYESAIDMPVEMRINKYYWVQIRPVVIRELNFSATLDLAPRVGTLGLVWTLRRIARDTPVGFRHLTLRVKSPTSVRLNQLIDFTALFADRSMLYRGRQTGTASDAGTFEQVRATVYDNKPAVRGPNHFTLEDQRAWHSRLVGARMNVTYECEDEDARIVLEGLQSLGQRLGYLGIQSKSDIEDRITAAGILGWGVPDEVEDRLYEWARMLENA